METTSTPRPRWIDGRLGHHADLALGPDKKSGQRNFEKHRAQLIELGTVVATGKNRETKYSLPE